MFSGIIEAKGLVLQVLPQSGFVQLIIERPSSFDDIKLGDSIATNGVCLTVEKLDANSLQFALGAETLQVTGWSVATLQNSVVNLERSMRLGDRIHGHLVSGHVDAMGEIVKTHEAGGCLFLDVQVPAALRPYLWKKGSWAMNGVSLTVNSFVNDTVQVCLIPETLKRTNLGLLKSGDKVTVEIDTIARGLIHSLQMQLAERLKENS
jgi:riboflavin synthase